MQTKMQVWTAIKAKDKLRPQSQALAKVGEGEVALKVIFCGVCHSDLHLINNDWGFSSYPMVPGHEIIGKVVQLGQKVKHLKVGDIVGVGWQASSCAVCPDCSSARDNLCEQSSATCVGHSGGFATDHITSARYCFVLSKNLRVAGAAPLLCGGITVYSPLRRFAKSASHVGIVGIGGLGHLAVKMAVKMGHEVTVFSSSESKRKEAISMGAHHFVSSTKAEQIEKLGRQLDLVLVTANVELPWTAFLKTLRADGTLCFVGIPPTNLSLPVVSLLNKQLKIAASVIGGREAMEEMLEFCSRHKILATTELFAMKDVNKALERVAKNQVRYRAVLKL